MCLAVTRHLHFWLKERKMKKSKNPQKDRILKGEENDTNTKGGKKARSSMAIVAGAYLL